MAESEDQRRGTFIVVEGLDRSGKSTQAALLVDRLKRVGVPARLFKFPDRTTPIGKMIDAYLRAESELDDHAVHLLFSANRWELASAIQRSLVAGEMVICDRYAFSGIAFSAAKQSAGLTYEWCRAPDICLPAPDITLFLDVTLETAKGRGGYGAERYEAEEVQARVRQVFARIGTDMDDEWISMGADGSVEEVAETVWSFVEPFSHGVAQPIGKLWEHLLAEKERNLELYL